MAGAGVAFPSPGTVVVAGLSIAIPGVEWERQYNLQADVELLVARFPDSSETVIPIVDWGKAQGHARAAVEEWIG